MDFAADRDAFVDLSADFYRGEMDRVSTWRTRLDQTTNWAVVVIAAILTWAFSSADNPHYVLLVGILATTMFLLVEAKRYKEYDAWRTRIRVMQKNLFAATYDAERPDSPDWRAWLGDDLRDPDYQLSLAWAVGHRLQDVYLPLLSVLLAAWALRVTVFETGETWRQTAGIASLSGEVVATAVALYFGALVALTLWSARKEARREFHDPSSYTGSQE